MIASRIMKPDGKGTTSLAVAIPAPRPVCFGAFHLGPDGLQIHGKPNFTDFGLAMSYADYCEQRSPFWKAALLNYGYSRPDWEERMDAFVNRWALTPRTLEQYRSVDRLVPPDRRVEGLSFSHCAAVASLPAEDQKPTLERAKREHLSVSDLRAVVRKERKVRRVLKGQSSDLAKAHDAVVEHAYEAASLCRQIPAHDCKEAEKMLTKALTELGRCEAAIARYRKAQGR